MNTHTTLSISEARRRIFDIAKDVQTPTRYYTLTENGRPTAVIMSAEEFESWQETFEVLKDFPHLDADLKSAHDEYRRGETITLDKFLNKEKNSSTLITQKSDAVSRRSAKKSSKRSR